MLDRFGPSNLWFISSRLWQAGGRRRARALKWINFLVFHAVLPPEAHLVERVRLGHYGLGVVVHPNVRIGRNVLLWHGVTLSVSDSPGTDATLTLGDDIEVGAHAVVITPLRSSLAIADGVRVGANAVVTSSITAAGSYAGVPARRLQRSESDVQR